MGTKSKTLREDLPLIRLKPGMIAEVNIHGNPDKKEILPAVQLWKRQDLLNMKVVWRGEDNLPMARRCRLILVLAKPRKGAKR